MALAPKPATTYDDPEMDMVFRVFRGSKGPGLISLMGLRKLTAAALAALDIRAAALEGRASAIEAAALNVATRTAALELRAGTIEASITALAARVTALEAKQPLITSAKATPGVLTLGSKVLTLTAVGVKKGDIVSVQPQVDLPSGLNIAWARSNADGTVSLCLSALIAVTLNTEVTFDIMAWRKGV